MGRHIPDLREVPFKVFLWPQPEDDPPVLDVYVAFLDSSKGKGSNSFVQSEAFSPLLDSDEAQKIYAIAKDIPSDEAIPGYKAVESSEHPKVEQLRKEFLQRVFDCHGVIDNECWALGKKAVEEVVRFVILGET